MVLMFKKQYLQRSGFTKKRSDVELVQTAMYISNILYSTSLHTWSCHRVMQNPNIATSF
jgi:hypothetical protein